MSPSVSFHLCQQVQYSSYFRTTHHTFYLLIVTFAMSVKAVNCSRMDEILKLSHKKVLSPSLLLSLFLHLTLLYTVGVWQRKTILPSLWAEQSHCTLNIQRGRNVVLLPDKLSVTHTTHVYTSPCHARAHTHLSMFILTESMITHSVSRADQCNWGHCVFFTHIMKDVYSLQLTHTPRSDLHYMQVLSTFRVVVVFLSPYQDWTAPSV